MPKLQVLLSLITEDNDYQQEQASQAQSTALRIGCDLRIIYAGGDAIVQSQQLLEAIQSRTVRPDAIIFEPAGTGLAVVAKAAAQANIGWVVMNRDVEYLPELRRSTRTPVFALSSDHIEVGRIQGRQLGRLLPGGGNVLYLQGPVSHLAAQQRSQGCNETKPANVNLRVLKGNWTERSGYDAIASWLRLSTSHETVVSAVAAHNDDMAIGARNAFQELTKGEEKNRWMSIPFLGCDGLPKTGQAYVERGILQASVNIPAITGTALEMLSKAILTGTQPPERTLTVPISLPSLDKLRSSSQPFQTTSA
ncbi:MAG TPA: sugar ABC transporter substrate-binding protein [Terriglobales bacterium]